MALWDRLKNGIIGGAVGFAARDALEPLFEPVKQEGWRTNRNRVLAPELAALLRAEDGPDPDQLADDVARQGYSDGRYAAMVEAARRAPGLGELFRLRRRKEISPEQFTRGLWKAHIPVEWHEPLRALLAERLSPADVANAVQQGFVPNADLLPPDPGGSPPFTPPIEEVPIDTLEEFAASGVPSGRATVLAQLVGLPPGVMELLQMWNRGIITETAVERGIREGHTKTKWTSALKELRHFLLSPQEAAGLRLRGWLTKGEAEALGELRGASAEVMELLYLNRGRPATTRQVHIGYARGGELPGAADEREAFAKAVAQSNIRTEYTDLLWASRYTYPSAFVIRSLTQAGTFDGPTSERILIESGWPPQYAALAAEDWSGAAGAGASAKWADRARTRLFTVAHNEYLDGSIDEATARGLLQRVGATGGEQDTIIGMWNAEQGIARLELSPTQIRKAYYKGRYTYDEAVAELVERQMTPEDADVFLTT